MKSVVILSGGLDSSFNLLKAQAEGEVKLALHFNYGQRAAVNEAAYARAFCERRDIPFQIIDVRFLNQWSKSALNNKTAELPVTISQTIKAPSRLRPTRNFKRKISF